MGCHGVSRQLPEAAPADAVTEARIKLRTVASDSRHCAAGHMCFPFIAPVCVLMRAGLCDSVGMCNC